MLLFTGIFSAATATLLSVSISDIRPNLQNTSQPSNSSSTGSSNQTVPSSPPTLSVWVNALWFLSLSISLTCAMFATMLQHGHARSRQVHILQAVEVLPLLLHISLFVFFAGLSTFLYGVNRTIFKVVTAWIGVCVIIYVSLSIIPVTSKDSPYYTPLSWVFSFCLTGIRYLFLRMFPSFKRQQSPSSDRGEDHKDNYFSYSMAKTVEDHVFKLDPEIDHRSLLWTFQSLDDEADFENFFEGLPRLCDSDTGKKLKLKEKFVEVHKKSLSGALIRLMDRTLKFNLVKEFVKHRRMVIFTEAMDSKSTSLLEHSNILRRVLFGDWDGLLGCMEFGLSMRKWADNLDKVTVTSFYAQCVAALTISESLKRKRLGHDRHGWIQLHDDDEHDDDILLANAIFVVRMAVQTYAGSEEKEWDDILKVSRKTLGAVCKLDRIQDTLPELRHEFCDLWNKLVTVAQTDELPHHRTIAIKMLKNIRKLYIALHPTGSSTPPTTFYTTEDWEQILDNSELYRKCTKEDHRSPPSRRSQAWNSTPCPLSPVPPAQPVVPAQPVPPTQSMVSTQPVPLTQPVPPTQPMVSTQPVPPIQPAAPRFPEPHTLTHHNTLYH
ncbi:hypothetical protein BGY98DRAFT_1100398 [Russula aff. rugulosa BPL654]|nr:hypothetical protein BGY98DRAFT_1100398 [Russula aff. rugulosa BPL654]